MTERAALGLCCIVRLPSGFERLLPLAVTNLAAEPPGSYPLALNLPSLEQLITTYQRVMQAREGSEDEPSRQGPEAQASPDQAAGGTPAALGQTETRPTRPGVAASVAGVPAAPAKPGAEA